jgi:uncharacterized membrane protein
MQGTGGPPGVVGGSAGVCDQNPCLNGGNCVAFFDSFTCACADGYTGELCRYPKFQGIGAVAGDVSSSISAISNDGAVVVGTSWDEHASIVDSATRSAFRFSVASALLEALNPTGLSDCTGVFTNVNGSSIIGNCKGLIRWTGSVVDWLAPALNELYVLNASRNGLVFVGSTRERRAFRWAQGSTDLLPCTAECCASADAVASNTDGSVVAIQCGLHAPYQWSETSGLKPLEIEDPAAVTVVNDVSGDGNVMVGYVDSSKVPSSAGALRAVTWRGGRLATLGSGTAYGCNQDGSIVWGRELIWDANGPHELLEAIGATPKLAGWSQLSVVDASDDGKVLVGNGIHEGHSEGWVAHVDLLGMPPITK